MAGVTISEPRSNQAVLMLTAPAKAAPATGPRVKSDARGPAPSRPAQPPHMPCHPASRRRACLRTRTGEKQSGAKLRWACSRGTSQRREPMRVLFCSSNFALGFCRLQPRNLRGTRGDCEGFQASTGDAQVSAAAFPGRGHCAPVVTCTGQRVSSFLKITDRQKPAEPSSETAAFPNYSADTFLGDDRVPYLD